MFSVVTSVDSSSEQASAYNKLQVTNAGSVAVTFNCLKFKFKNTTDETTNPRFVTSQKTKYVTMFFSATWKRNWNGTRSLWCNFLYPQGGYSPYQTFVSPTVFNKY
jgi:hypothetical protein